MLKKLNVRIRYYGAGMWSDYPNSEVVNLRAVSKEDGFRFEKSAVIHSEDKNSVVEGYLFEKLAKAMDGVGLDYKNYDIVRV